MKYRCPYCKHLIEASEPPSLCPACHKAMTIPDHLRKRTFRQRKKDREKIQNAAERERARLFSPAALTGKKASVLLIILGTMILAGGALIYKAENTTKPGSDVTRILRTENELTALRIALELFLRDCGRYPTTKEGLFALVDETGIEGWNGRYVNKIKPDQWRTPYQYALKDGQITLYSFGPDRTDNTDDDLHAQLPEEFSSESDDSTDSADSTGKTQIHEVNLHPNR